MKCKLAAYISFLTFSVVSCDIFQKEPLDAVPEVIIWNNYKYANLYLNSLYSKIMPTFSAGSNSSLSDETFGGTNYMYGQLNNESVSDFNKINYGIIREINWMIEHVKAGGIPSSEKQILIGQAVFLRAWMYWKLVNLYGGVPMILNSQKLLEYGDLAPEVFVTRNKTSECVRIIAADLDTASMFLPAKWPSTDYGRITRGAAMALKGRVLLFWASPQFNPNNKQERWEWAYDVNKAAYDTLKKDGYGLYKSFEDLFSKCIENTIEGILVRVYNPADFSHTFDRSVRPVYESKAGSGASNQPTWNLVRAFPKKDGYPVDSTSTTTYNDRYFWLNRDPRLNFTVAHNTNNWPLSGQTTYKIWTYYYLKNGVLTSVEKNERAAGDNYTKSGFYCKKFVNPLINKTNLDALGTDWMEIRFAEVILNLAECANELQGKEAEVSDLINQIRNGRDDIKVGMGYVTKHLYNKDIMREVIMTERQVEFAFENKRHWDLRRRNMFEEDLGPSIKKLNGTRRTGWVIELNEARITPESMALQRDGLNFASTIIVNAYFSTCYRDTLDTQYPIDYPQPKYNFYAIPQTNIDKNVNLMQTTYWGGSFDPLEE